MGERGATPGHGLRSTAPGEYLQGEGEIPRALEPAVGFLLQAAVDHLGDRGADLRLERRRVVVENRVAALDQRAAGEGAAAGEHLVEDSPEAEEVGAGV